MLLLLFLVFVVLGVFVVVFGLCCFRCFCFVFCGFLKICLLLFCCFFALGRGFCFVPLLFLELEVGIGFGHWSWSCMEICFWRWLLGLWRACSCDCKGGFWMFGFLVFSLGWLFFLDLLKNP